MENFIKTMPRRAPLWLLAAMFGMTLQSCSDDDNNFTAVDNQQPQISMTDHLQVEIGSEFIITGKITDQDGIRSISLRCPDMYLDKTIDMLEIYGDSLIKEYDLSYKYDAPDDWTETMQMNVDVTVEDVVGNVSTTTLLVTPDGDYTAPTFTANFPAEITVQLTAPILSLNYTVTDNKGLKYITVKIPELEINDSIPTGDVAEYNLSREYELPGTVASYAMTVTLGDQFDNVNTYTSTVNVSADFPKMYLSDVTGESQLTTDLYGVPMLIDHPEEFVYEARYYNYEPGREIWFIPQKTGFAPVRFGLDPSTGKITNDTEKAQPIVLDEVAYYQINFNTQTGEYSATTYTPTDDPFPQGQMFTENGIEQPYELSLAGAGLPGVGNWSTADPYLLTADPENPYHFYAEMTLTAGTVIEFTITPKSASGWWPSPFWRFENGDNDSGENEYHTLNNGNNMTKVTVKTTGKYRFDFDTHLLRSKFQLIN